MEIKILRLTKEAAIADKERRNMDEKGFGDMSVEEQYRMDFEWYLDSEGVRTERIEVHPNQIGMIKSQGDRHCEVYIPIIRESYIVPYPMEKMKNLVRKGRLEAQTSGHRSG